MIAPPEPGPKWRPRARAALEDYFRKRSHPRFILGLLVITSGIAGYLASYLLLRCGIGEMWQRYPIAVAGGYIAFLVQLRLWVEIERDRYDKKYIQADVEPPKAPSPEPRRDHTPDSSWFEWLDAPLDLFSLDEGCLAGCFVTLVAGAVIGAGGLMFSFIMAGPELLAEVFLDAVVVSLLYRHLKNAARQHWLGTAVKRSWRLVLAMAAALALLGACLSFFAPNSNSFGKALREIMHGTGPR